MEITIAQLVHQLVMAKLPEDTVVKFGEHKVASNTTHTKDFEYIWVWTSVVDGHKELIIQLEQQ